MTSTDILFDVEAEEVDDSELIPASAESRRKANGAANGKASGKASGKARVGKGKHMTVLKTGKDLRLLDTMVPGRDLGAYITAVNGIAILSAEEEQELAHQYYYQNDLEAARKLVLAHLRFVVHVAKSYSGYGLAEADLIQEGNVGLMKAVKRFNPEVGVRLVSFAVHWIKAEIH